MENKVYTQSVHELRNGFVKEVKLGIINIAEKGKEVDHKDVWFYSWAAPIVTVWLGSK